jgi:hypothetical protein
MIVSFTKTVARLTESIRADRLAPLYPDINANCGEAVQFILDQHARSPDWVRLPLRGFTLLFDLMGIAFGGRVFHCQPLERRSRLWQRCRSGTFGPFSDLIRFYEGLVIFDEISKRDE